MQNDDAVNGELDQQSAFDRVLLRAAISIVTHSIYSRARVFHRSTQQQATASKYTSTKHTLQAHPALQVDDLDTLIAQLAAAGVDAVPGEKVDGYRARVFVEDPFGNRIELLELG